MTRWETLSLETFAETRVFRVLRKLCRHPARDVTQDFFVISSQDWVNVIALTTDHHLVMVNQYRFGRDTISLEIPGGLVDQGEDPIAAGIRELREETGFVGGRSRLLATVDPNPAIQDNACHLVFADGVSRAAPQDWDEHEEIEVLTIPAGEVLAMARAGAIKHALSLNALFFFEAEWHRRGVV